jgi:hypothetical protein
LFRGPGRRDFSIPFPSTLIGPDGREQAHHVVLRLLQVQVV